MATEEPQLGSIQQRIAALKQSQTGGGADPPFIRPGTERSKSANNPPSYEVAGSVLDGAAIGNKPAEPQVRRPAPTPPSRPTPSPKPKVPPPLPTRKAQPPPPPSRPPSRPALPQRRPTEESTRRPSVESVTSDASYSTANTAGTSVGRGASTTSVNSIGNGRIKAPAWGETELPTLPPRRPKEDPVDISPAPRSESKSNASSGGLTNGLSSKLQSLRGKASSSPAPSAPARPARPSLPTRPSQADLQAATPPPMPKLPPRRPTGNEPPSYETSERRNGPSEEAPPSLPVRRLPPQANAADLNSIRQNGFGNLNKAPGIPARPSSTPAQNGEPNGGPPPIPHGSRPDLSKLQATKPRSHAMMPGASQAATSQSTECMVCRDFSAPDKRGAQYPRASLPSHDIGWLANELTAPFPSPTDKARAIFSWMHHNVHYDVVAFFNNNVRPSTPANTLATGLAVCEGYAGLFAALANKAGLEAIVVGGHGKGYGYTPLAPGQSPPPFSAGHAWNAVKIDGGKWKLVDPCWGAGTVNEGEPYRPGYNPSMFTMSNEEFGLKHFPQNKDHFFRDDGRYTIPWEEYITTNPDMPTGLPPIQIYSDVGKHSIGKHTIQPQSGKLSVSSTPSPLRFQFGLLCEHWTLAHHSRLKPALFLLMIHGIDGRKDDQLPFKHAPGSGPGGGGEFWYVDVPDAHILGAAGQKVQLAVLTSFGDRKDCRGLTADEYLSKKGRIGMAWAYVCEWQLIQ